MISFLFTPIGRYVGIAIVLAIIMWGMIAAIKQSGADSVILIMKDNTIGTLRERAKINEKTNTADDPTLCLAIGGVFNRAENKCM